MIQMPLKEAKEGKEAVIRILERMSRCDHDKNVSKEVIQYLGQQIARATPEDVEIIMAWMFVGAITDRLMSEVAAKEMVKELVEAIVMQTTMSDDEIMEA